MQLPQILGWSGGERGKRRKDVRRQGEDLFPIEHPTSQSPGGICAAGSPEGTEASELVLDSRAIWAPEWGEATVYSNEPPAQRWIHWPEQLVPPAGNPTFFPPLNSLSVAKRLDAGSTKEPHWGLMYAPCEQNPNGHSGPAAFGDAERDIYRRPRMH